MTQSGYSLIELMVVVTIVGIIAAAAAPYYGEAVEQARCDQAIETLRSVWSAQRMHRLEHGVYATSLEKLDDAGLLDRSMKRSDALFAYSMSGSDSTFLVEAKRLGTSWQGSFRISETGDLSGSVEDRGGRRVTP